MKPFFNFPGLAVIMVLITLISCEKQVSKDYGLNKCNVSNPVEEIGWLKEAINNVKNDEYSYYAMANYKGETVFYYGNCNPLANFISNVRNCSGENLGYTNDLRNELTNITIIWKHQASKCTFR